VERFELHREIDHGRRTLEVWELIHRDFTTRDLKPSRLVSVSGENLERIRPAIMEALRANRLSQSSLAEWNTAPIRLDEEWGVRLGLLVKLVGPLKSQDRVRAMVEGVLTMSREESLFWFAKCYNGCGPQYTIGLRICLAEGIG
jgi:hypothetical protein